MRQRLKTEIDQYFIMIQTKMNEDILFGSEIIFKHVESDTYLMCSDQCSDFRTDAFKLELSTSLSSAVIFKIIPFHSYQQDGQSIHFDEPLRIQSEGQRFWIDSVKGKEVFIDEIIHFDQSSVNIGIDSISFDNFRPRMRRVSKNSHRYEAVISHNGKEAWKFKLHEHYDQISEKNKLKPYDLCVFKYTSINSYLSCNLFNGKLILKEQKENLNHYNSLDSVWEIQPYYSKQQWDFNNLASSSIQQLSQVKQSELLKKSKMYQSQA